MFRLLALVILNALERKMDLHLDVAGLGAPRPGRPCGVSVSEKDQKDRRRLVG